MTDQDGKQVAKAEAALSCVARVQRTGELST